jgi:nitrate reductase / nitrite oxidoreductase, alpha subunit
LTRRREPFADGLGELREEDRMWEVNCTGGCCWKICLKSGVVTWETQQTDYPRTRPDMPNHEPRGCSRGASYSWYLYSGRRIKYSMVHSRLVKAWREARKTMAPTDAWAAIIGKAEA